MNLPAWAATVIMPIHRGSPAGDTPAPDWLIAMIILGVAVLVITIIWR